MTLIPMRVRKKRTLGEKIAVKNQTRFSKMKGFQIWFWKDRDAELLEWIELNRPFMGYVRRLIEQDLFRAKCEASKVARRKKKK